MGILALILNHTILLEISIAFLCRLRLYTEKMKKKYEFPSIQKEENPHSLEMNGTEYDIW